MENDVVIQILEDHGYSGIDLLNKLENIYKEYQAKHIKQFEISNLDYFIYLKDLIWFNFEHKINFADIEQAKGSQTLRYFGSKFPNLTHLFDGVNVVPCLYLPTLLDEINKVIELWRQDDSIYLINVYIDENVDLHGGENATEIIIYSDGENPQKYNSEALSFVANDSLNNERKRFAYGKILGKLNKNEQLGKIIYSLLINLKDTTNLALQNHKDLSLIVR